MKHFNTNFNSMLNNWHYLVKKQYKTVADSYKIFRMHLDENRVLSDKDIPDILHRSSGQYPFVFKFKE